MTRLGQTMLRSLQVTCYCALLVISAGAYPHHAPFIYDLEREEVFTATVVSFAWVQPHTRVIVATPGPDGVDQTWDLEGMHPGFLGRRGWNRYSLQAGDVIEVTYFPRRDGSREGMFLRAAFADGSVKVMALNPAAPR
jgi:hypothetical protein